MWCYKLITCKAPSIFIRTPEIEITIVLARQVSKTVSQGDAVTCPKPPDSQRQSWHLSHSKFRIWIFSSNPTVVSVASEQRIQQSVRRLRRLTEKELSITSMKSGGYIEGYLENSDNWYSNEWTMKKKVLSLRNAGRRGEKGTNIY